LPDELCSREEPDGSSSAISVWPFSQATPAALTPDALLLGVSADVNRLLLRDGIVASTALVARMNQ